MEGGNFHAFPAEMRVALPRVEDNQGVLFVQFLPVSYLQHPDSCLKTDVVGQESSLARFDYQPIHDDRILSSFPLAAANSAKQLPPKLNNH